MKALFRPITLSVLWRAVRKRVAQDNPYVIAVTGSVGKTSTKEAIALLLAESGKPVVKTLANLATDTGIPLSLIGVGQQVKTRSAKLTTAWKVLFPRFPKFTERPYYVLELSSDAPGDIAFLAKHFPIHVAVFTTGGPVHMEYYKTEEAVVQELASLLPFIQKDGYCVSNADDAHLANIWRGTELPLTTFALHHKKADLLGHIQERKENGVVCSFSWQNHAKPSVDQVHVRSEHILEATCHIIGEQQLYPLLAAVCVAKREGLKESQIVKGLEKYELVAGRGRLIEGDREVTIIDDTANSSPEAVIGGLAMLKPFAGKRRTVAILGTMNELGTYSKEAHESIGAAAAGKVGFLVALGIFAPQIVEGAKKEGMPSTSIIAFPTPQHLMSQLQQVVQRGDVVYLKASQNGMRLEQVVKQLMLHPEQATELLVRQGKEWE